MTINEDLFKNKHFLICLMEPYIMGAEKQLERVLTVHTCIKDPARYTITQHYVFIYELSSLLEHLNMISKCRSNAGLAGTDLEKKINDFRNEIRHTGRFDEIREDRNKRLGKKTELRFELRIADSGIKIGTTQLSFKEIDMYIQQIKLELTGIL